MADPSKTAEELLGRLGLGEYESRAYLALVRHGPATGYAVAKASGVPRPNVYPLLSRLEERGLVIRLEGSSEATVRYAAVPPAEFLARLKDEMDRVVREAQRVLSDVGGPLPERYIGRLQGRDAVMAHARGLAQTARQSLLLAVWPEEARELGPTTQRAVTSGIEVTTFCMAACDVNCGGCHGDVHRYGRVGSNGDRAFAIVADGDEALLGSRDTAIRTQEPLLVRLLTDYIRQGIVFGAFAESLGWALPDAVTSAPAEGGLREWLQRLLRRKR